MKNRARRKSEVFVVQSVLMFKVYFQGTSCSLGSQPPSLVLRYTFNIFFECQKKLQTCIKQSIFFLLIVGNSLKIRVHIEGLQMHGNHWKSGTQQFGSQTARLNTLETQTIHAAFQHQFCEAQTEQVCSFLNIL